MKNLVTLKKNLLKSALFISLSAISIFASASVNTVKPVSFTAVVNTINTNKVDLKWSTETETNLSHFIVERSIDGTNFTDAALVFAYGNTTSKSDYAFADNISKIKSGVVYYRVSSIGSDGKNQSSDIMIIRTNK
jgi:hypothetical protein